MRKGGLSSEMGFDASVFGRFDLAALVQPHLQFVQVCLLDGQQVADCMRHGIFMSSLASSTS